jgi:hypothetical protein
VPTRLRRKRQRLEIYRLEEGRYILQPGNTIWMPEIGLGIGRERGTYRGRTREWLFWYDRDGTRYPTPEESDARQRQELAQAQQQLEELLAKLQQQGIDPNTL